MRKKSYLRPIIVGFVVLYILCMLIATWIVEQKYRNEYARNYNDMLRSAEFYFDDPAVAGDGAVTDILVSYLDVAGAESKYQQFSVAIYGPDNQKYSQLHGMIYLPYLNKETYQQNLEEYFTIDEIESLFRFYDSSKDWIVEANYEKETNVLLSLRITQRTDSGKAPEWTWENSDATDVDLENTFNCMETYYSMRNIIRVPYFAEGIDRYKQWIEDDFLQSFPEYYEQDSTILSVRSISGLEVNDETGTALIATNTGSGSYTLVLRSTSKPLLATFDALKFVYPIGLIFMVFCVIVVIFFLNKTYKERQAIVEMRRDFTNAIAHELKTPLGIIRNFTENLIENTNAEKESYYLRQIRKQTEVMKDMAREMSYISNLDSEELTLSKTPISIREVIEEQYEKLTPLADEKNLEIRYEETAEFIVNGDKIYLEKAIWNLLSNAVVYNRLDGIIIVQTDSHFCSIENTGKKIADADLPYVFELFYTGDKSRSSERKHLGLGLYLAKRIMKLHRLNLAIENTDTGVKVTIRK